MLQLEMASNVFVATQCKSSTPEQGSSFSLDHKEACEQFYLKYMVCLSNNDNLNTKCGSESKDYLNCRIQKGLMARKIGQSSEVFAVR